MKLEGVSHIAMAVENLDEALAKIKEMLGVAPIAREVVASQMTEVALLPLGQTHLELITPRGNASLERFLAKRGPALHHISLAVDDIDAALAELKAKGAKLVDETARPGARGHRVAFVHPSTFGGLLVELEEEKH